tara:strand:- start:171 stop:716 length:546 start_codon:yes stop_codon:yes gene_type:complete
VNKSNPDKYPTVAVLTVSDRSALGLRKDLSGPAVVQSIHSLTGWDCTEIDIVSDDVNEISAKLSSWADDDKINLIITTGGTGMSIRDVTPEATLTVIEREAPGLMEAVRAASLSITPYAMLSRAVAGIRGHSLIINLPGNPKAVNEALTVLATALPHALDLISDHHTNSQHHSRKPEIDSE